MKKYFLLILVLSACNPASYIEKSFELDATYEATVGSKIMFVELGLYSGQSKEVMRQELIWRYSK